MADGGSTQFPSQLVPPHELPASLRESGLTNWIREPLADAVDQRRRIMMPPTAALMGTPAAQYRDVLSDELRHGAVAMMGGGVFLSNRINDAFAVVNADAPQEIFRVLEEEGRLEETVDQEVRKTLSSYSRPAPEGSSEWEVLYNKTRDEVYKRRLRL